MSIITITELQRERKKIVKLAKDNKLKMIKRNIADFEKRIIKADKNSKRHLMDWSGKEWIIGVKNHYLELQKEFEKSVKHVEEATGKESSLLNKKLRIELLGIIKDDYCRVYSLLTPWMLDMVIEFKTDLDLLQNKRLKEAGATMVSPLTDERSRWVIAGTSLVRERSVESLKRSAKLWAEDAYIIANRVLHKLHDINGENNG